MEVSELEERLVLGGDQLRVTLEEDPELNGTYAVAGDGTIDLGELGRVHVGEKTIPESAEAIKEYLERKYFKIATVSVSISEFVSGDVRVTGPGGKGGASIKLTSDKTITLFEAIIQAGGLGPRADMSLVKILRWKPGGGLQREIITVDVQDMFDKLDFTNDEYLRPRDIVYIPNRSGESANEILYIGDVSAIGYHAHYEGMNLLRFIATTGGVSRSAQGESARILRPNGSGDYTPIPINITLLLSQGDMSQNKELLPGDIVYVPAKELASAGSVFAFGKGVRSPGPIALPLNEELTVARAMMRIGFTQFAKQSKVILRRVDPEGNKQEIYVDVKEILESGNFEDDVPLQDGDMIKVDEGIINL